MAALQGEVVHVLRFLLVSRGRLHPRRELYLASWIPPRFRSRINAVFDRAAAAAARWGVLLKIDPGMQGRRWLFLLEGLPTVLLGLLILRLLPATPEEAHWLSDAQRRGLRAVMEAEAAPRQPAGSLSLDPRLRRVPPALLGPLADPPERLCGHLALAYFLPTILKTVRHHAAGNRRAADDPERGGAGLSYAVGRSRRTQRRHPLAPAVVCLIGSGGFLLLPVAATVSLALFLVAVSIITGYTIALLRAAEHSAAEPHRRPCRAAGAGHDHRLAGRLFGPTLTGWVSAGDRQDAGRADIRADDAGQRRAGDRLRAHPAARVGRLRAIARLNARFGTDKETGP